MMFDRALDYRSMVVILWLFYRSLMVGGFDRADSRSVLVSIDLLVTYK
jgi:hypothetical protein